MYVFLRSRCFPICALDSGINMSSDESDSFCTNNVSIVLVLDVEFRKLKF